MLLRETSEGRKVIGWIVSDKKRENYGSMSGCAQIINNRIAEWILAPQSLYRYLMPD